MEDNQKGQRLRFVRFFWLICLIITLCTVTYYWLFWWDRVYTDDAYVEGNKVYITPLTKGFITAIHTDDTFFVKEGQLLVELDETDAIIALEKSKHELGKIVREVCGSFHEAAVQREGIEVVYAELIKTAQDYRHRLEAIEVEGVSIEDLEHATAALRSSYHTLKNKEALYKRALSFIQGTSIKSHPYVKGAVDHMRNMWVYHYRCKIYSPVSGLVAERKIQVGMHVKEGEPLLSVIPLNQIWVNANFKETQLKDVRIGQKATVTSDLYGSEVVYHGEVIGLPGGAGNAFSLLPPQNLSGNWIKIVQRLPVRIALNPKEILSHPLRVGLSMEVTVDTSDKNGLLVPTSAKGSPTYFTTIYQKEELGDLEAANAIIMDNIDASLAEFADHPFIQLPLNLESAVKQLFANLNLDSKKIIED